MLRFLSIAALAFLLSTSLRAAEAELASGAAGSVTWTLTSPFDRLPAAGFVPVSVSATNGGIAAVKVDYALEGSSAYSNSGSTMLASGSLDLALGKTGTATHWIWRGAEFGSPESADYISITLSTPSGNSSNQIGQGYNQRFTSAVSENIVKAEPSRFSRGARRGLTADGGILATQFSPDSLPADWRVFSGFQTLFLTPDDWDQLSPGVRDAMRLWLGFGGTVRVVSVEKKEGRRVIDELLPSDSRLGVFGARVPVIPMSFNDLRNDGIRGDRETIFRNGIPSAGFTDIDRRSSRQRYRNGQSFNPYQSFPLRDLFGRRDIPYFPICMLLIAFAVIVGPVSLKYWAPAGRRHRLFFTTPVFSLATSGLLLVVMLFQDGLGIDGRRFTILDLAPADSSQPDAIVYQEQFTRAGMTGGGGFELAEGLMPLLPNDSYEESLSVIGEEAKGSWFASRRDRSMALVGATPVRWKVTQESVGEKKMTLRIESPFTEFDDAWFIDEKGQGWRADGAGMDTDGLLTFNSASNDPAGLMEPMFKNCSSSLRDSMLARIRQKSQRNRFWAQVSDPEAASQGAIPTRKKIDWIETKLILTSKVTPK